MTNDRFDDLTKLIGQRASRRTVLKGVVASALAAVFGRVAAPGTRAVHVPCVGTKPNNNTCTADAQCCSNNCVAQPNGRPSRCAACTADSQCESGACIEGICLRSPSGPGGVCTTTSHCRAGQGLTCVDGTCQCPEGQSACGTTCCASGQCNATTSICCTAGQTPCGRGCCPSGRCNQSTGVCCPAGQSACGTQCCASGQCNQTSRQCCAAGTVPCGSTCCPSGRCNQTSGTCCPSTQVACGTGCCSGGQCNQGSGICCPLGQKPCGDGCCDPDLCTDVGVCCSGGTVICADGTCGLAVGTGTCVTSDDCCGDDTFCDGTGTCQTLNTNPVPGCQGEDACLGNVQCGDPGVDCRCGTTIEGGGVCWAAGTGCSRPGGALPCETSSDCASGLCVATPNACGANGAGICPNSSGVCVDPCSSLGCPHDPCAVGETCCGTACVDIATDVNNCGACGTACTAPANGTPTCANGICGFQCDAGAILCGGTACCGASEFCDGGTSTCQPLDTNPDTTCAGVDACLGGTSCGVNCFCGTSIEGGGVCFDANSGCYRAGGAIPCESSHECPTGLCVAIENACGLPGVCPSSSGVCADRCTNRFCTVDTDCASGSCDTVNNTPGICAVVVNTAMPNGWTPSVSQGGATQTASFAFVAGPGTPPLGDMGAGDDADGSFELRVGADGNNAAQIRTTAYDGVRLADITQLVYWTYVQTNVNEQAPYLLVHVDQTNDGTVDDLLFFEPAYQDSTFIEAGMPDQGDVVLNTWQDWNAADGCWYSLNGAAGLGPGANCNSLDVYTAAFPNAVIRNTSTGAGGLRIVAGFGAGAWDNFVGNVDALSITVAGATDSYDFEED